VKGWWLVAGALVALGASDARSQSRDDAVYRAMRDELARSMARLRLDTMPQPYFIAYRVDEFDYAEATASLGGLLRSDEMRQRRLSVEVRVGDYVFDNTNYMGGTGESFGGGLRWRRRLGDATPLDTNYTELRRQFWLATDAAYKEAVETLANKRAALYGRGTTDYVPDFSREDVATISDVTATAPLDRAAAEAMVRQLSSLFREHTQIQQSEIAWNAGVVRTWYLDARLQRRHLQSWTERRAERGAADRQRPRARQPALEAPGRAARRAVSGPGAVRR
jgi:hypothetical protein